MRLRERDWRSSKLISLRPKSSTVASSPNFLLKDVQSSFLDHVVQIKEEREGGKSNLASFDKSSWRLMHTFYYTFLFIDGLGFLGAGGHCLITGIFIFIFCFC